MTKEKLEEIARHQLLGSTADRVINSHLACLLDLNIAEAKLAVEQDENKRLKNRLAFLTEITGCSIEPLPDKKEEV